MARQRRNPGNNDAQIFVSGTWRSNKAAAYADDARRVGQLIAEAGYSLGCGPGTGIARHAIDGFRSVPGRAGKVRYFLPAESYMRAVGEEVEPGADRSSRPISTTRCATSTKSAKSAGLVIITGGDGALEEVLPALADYDLPVAAKRGSGQAAAALDALVQIFPEWEPNVHIADDPDTLVSFMLGRVSERRAAARA